MTYQETKIEAGSFSAWLEMTKKSIANGTGITVPCGSCGACCRSAFYIAVRQNEIKAFAHIPKELLSEIPGVPEVYYIGFNEQGHCPLLIDDLCSIYEYRPHSCKTFDCRVYTATGIKLDKEDNSPINMRVNEWKFSYATKNDRIQQGNLLRAVSILKENLDPGSMDPPTENRRLLALNAILHSERINTIWNEDVLK